jgi:hypothetical protein
MGEGFIVRKGGVAEEVLRTTNPSINFVSKTNNQIVVTFTNNDATEADVFYGLTSPLTDKVTLATATTSSNITFSGLDPDTSYTISAYSIVTDATLKKIKSEIVSTSITTDTAPVYTAATGGTTLEYDLDGKRYKSHTFLENGTFTVTQVGDAIDDRNKVDYLIIAGGGGGGGGGSSRAGGGGGAGGYRTTLGTSGRNSAARDKITVTTTTYGITVGGGGVGGLGGSSPGASAFPGVNSTALGITSIGGGNGRGIRINTTGNGGSGGGGAESTFNNQNLGGTGTADEGFNGGDGHITDPDSGITSGGGGGASELGGNGTPTIPGKGGDGLANILRDGTSETRGGGGGGAHRTNSASGASGGSGGGGGGGGGNIAGINGTANTGGGGGGSAQTQNGGSGGSGIVIIRYEIAPA